MTEQPLLPPPGDAPEPVVVAPKRRQRDLIPWLYGLGFLVLAAAIFYLYQYPSTPDGTVGDASVVQATEQRLTDIDTRLTQVEKRPTPDLGKLSARVDALDGRIADQTRLANQLDVLSARIEALSGRDQIGLDDVKQQLDALAARIAAIASSAVNLDVVTNRLNRVARLQEASFALAAGRPIGELPNAPEALARYAHAAPPTDVQLRQRFTRDEQIALAAKQSAENDAPFIDRILNRMQGLITVRRGDNVVVGSSDTVILSHAQAALDADDIVGAVNAVEGLKGQPSRVMADWLADAKALIGARAALTDMADQT